jgi:hypothetical protein
MQALSKSLRCIRVHDSHAQRLGSEKQEARLSRVAQRTATQLKAICVHDGRTVVHNAACNSQDCGGPAPLSLNQNQLRCDPVRTDYLLNLADTACVSARNGVEELTATWENQLKKRQNEALLAWPRLGLILRFCTAYSQAGVFEEDHLAR